MRTFKPSSIVILALCFSAVDAQACGEVMYRMGNALRYHAFITRNPATILLYVGTAAREHAANDPIKFHDNLEKAGHKVTLANGPDELTKALATHPYDVVIAYAGDLDTVATQIASGAREPTLIPVVDRGAPNERQIRERFPRIVSDDANLNQFLKVIEQSMKAKGA
ncbi:MAG: hypothetical protein ACHP7D_02355 [Lysobacterales bacterium]